MLLMHFCAMLDAEVLPVLELQDRLAEVQVD